MSSTLPGDSRTHRTKGAVGLVVGASVTLTLLISLARRDSYLDLIGDHRVSSHDPITLEDHIEALYGMLAKRTVSFRSILGAP